ncbi:hypothetical protein BDF22DRAFT_773615, partial [Syncephalis plumigaleata]
MNSCMLEQLVVVLPKEERNLLFDILDEDALLELECTSKTIQWAIQHSMAYWRGKYARKYPWRYVTNEKNFLIAYRNKEWQEIGYCPDPTDKNDDYDELSSSALVNINWKEVYRYRTIVEKHWHTGLYRDHSFTWGNRNSHYFHVNSQCTIPYINMYFHWDTDIDHEPARLRYAKSIKARIASLVDEQIQQSDKQGTRRRMKKRIDIIYVNCFYTMIMYESRLFIQPTYSREKLIEFAIPPHVYHNDVCFERTLGRWGIFHTTMDARAKRLINLSNGRIYPILNENMLGALIYTATSKDVTMLIFKSITANQLNWRCLRYTPTANDTLDIEMTHRGSLTLEIPDLAAVYISLGPNYVAIRQQLLFPANKSYMTICSFDMNDSQSSRIVGTYPNGNYIYRIGRYSAAIMYSYYCNLVDLRTGDIQVLFEFPLIMYNPVKFAYPALGTIFARIQYDDSTHYFNCDDLENSLESCETLNFIEFSKELSSTKHVLTAFVTFLRDLEFSPDSQ